MYKPLSTETKSKIGRSEMSAGESKNTSNLASEREILLHFLHAPATGMNKK